MQKRINSYLFRRGLGDPLSGSNILECICFRLYCIAVILQAFFVTKGFVFPLHKYAEKIAKNGWVKLCKFCLKNYPFSLCQKHSVLAGEFRKKIHSYDIKIVSVQEISLVISIATKSKAFGLLTHCVNNYY